MYLYKLLRIQQITFYVRIMWGSWKKPVQRDWYASRVRRGRGRETTKHNDAFARPVILPAIRMLPGACWPSSYNLTAWLGLPGCLALPWQPESWPFVFLNTLPPFSIGSLWGLCFVFSIPKLGEFDFDSYSLQIFPKNLNPGLDLDPQWNKP